MLQEAVFWMQHGSQKYKHVTSCGYPHEPCTNEKSVRKEGEELRKRKPTRAGEDKRGKW